MTSHYRRQYRISEFYDELWNSVGVAPDGTFGFENIFNFTSYSLKTTGDISAKFLEAQFKLAMGYRTRSHHLKNF